MKKVVIIDGQGGRMGAALASQLKAANLPSCEIVAIGANSAATTAMLKAGADAGATGENPVVVNCADADLITGPMGIITANALLGGNHSQDGGGSFGKQGAETAHPCQPLLCHRGGRN